MSGEPKKKTRTVLAENPLEGEDLLRDAVFGGGPMRSRPRARTADTSEKPQHYKIVSISLYNEDIERLNRMVKELKKRGVYKANKSQLIRHALKQVDLDKLPGNLDD